MPDRMIRDRARRSPTLQAQSDASERAWWRLTITADDYGRFDADAEVLLSDLFPRRPSGWTSRRMRAVLDEWTRTGLVHVYENGDGRPYGHMVTWFEHQRRRESKPKFPEPPCGELPQSAAKCGESRQFAASSVFRGTDVRGTDVPRDEVVAGAGPPQVAAASPPGVRVVFSDFWAIYPRKTAKDTARKAWDKLAPDADLGQRVLGAVATQRLCPEWQKDGGRFIPHAATWLHGRRWEDEPTALAGADRKSINDAWKDRPGGEVRL